jgi:hypothetical protein
VLRIDSIREFDACREFECGSAAITMFRSASLAIRFLREEFMKIAAIAAAIAGFLYLIFHASKASAAKPVSVTAGTQPIGTNASTQIPMAQGTLSFFSSPSPVIKNGSLLTSGVTTGPTLQQALPTGIATPAAGGISPSLLVPLVGSPAVTSTNDINPGLDYPGIQSYMMAVDVPDPNAVAWTD